MGPGNQLEALDEYDVQLAGYNAIFLGGGILFYWIIVFMFEYKIIDFLLCQGRKKTRDDLIKGHDALADQTDPDVMEEANRVKNMDP